jgi:predicted outer membrane repeat protein
MRCALKLAFAPALVLLAMLGSTPAHAEGARILEAPGLPPFTSLQTAVDAAADGDTILVAAGTYGSVTIDGKGLSLIAAPDQIVLIEGTIEVLNLPAASTVLLSALRVTGATLEDFSAPGLVVTACAGHVRVEACILQGGAGEEPPGESQTFGKGGHAVVLQASPQVAFSRCTIAGGDGGEDDSNCYDCTGGEGGLGVRVSLSTPAFYDCTIEGGAGGENGYEGGAGGHGLRLLNSWMFASGSSFTGGGGGNAWDFIWAEGGDGGSGLFVDPSAQAELLDNTYAGGLGGIAICFTPQNNGAPGAPKAGGGSFDEHPDQAREFAASRVVLDDGVVLVHVAGEPGDQVWLHVGSQPAFQPLLSYAGVRLVKPAHIATASWGTIGPSGTLSLEVPAPDLALEPGRVLYLQGFGRNGFGMYWLGGPMQALVIDRQAAPDCNGNQQNDLVDAFLHFSPDCGPNLQPDECDPDCNSNGTPDDCDLKAGFSVDCNANDVPDSCDIALGFSPDCNGNSVPDECDLEAGTSSDLNGNGIPDECDPNVTWWVDAAAPPGGNGSAAQPFQAIDEGVQAAIDGDEIVVRDGTYTGPGNKAIAFAGREIVVRSQNGALGCVIDLQDEQRAFLVDNAGPGTRIEGFTIRRGLSGQGGAIHATFSEPTIRGCVFEGCIGSSAGGALYLSNSGSFVENCVFRDNRTYLFDPNMDLGGAIFVGGQLGTPKQTRIRRCLFEANNADDGGAIHVSGKSPVSISHCTFRSNSASRWGGAIQDRSLGVLGGIVTVDDCLFAGNVAGEDGGALYARSFQTNYATDLRVHGCTLSGNSAGSTGGALAVESNNQALLTNCVLWGNSATFGDELALDDNGSTTFGVPKLTVRRCDVAGGQAGVHQVGGVLTWGVGNIDVDPQFSDPDGPDNNPSTFFDNNYNPIAGSPVNDAGDNALVPPDQNDIDDDGNTVEPTPLDLLLQPRFLEDPLAPNVGAGTPPLVDMGCFEYP